jgi:hypothetical protein
MQNLIKIQKAYNAIYDYTDIAGDDALELLDDVIKNYNCYDIYSNWLNEDELTDAEAVLLLDCLEAAADECEEEFGSI